jgi:hypothetical protein
MKLLIMQFSPIFCYCLIGQIFSSASYSQSKKKKVKLSRYMPWRHMEGKEEKLLLILNLGTRWG